jgi:hypothetical protein
MTQVDWASNKEPRRTAAGRPVLTGGQRLVVVSDLLEERSLFDTVAEMSGVKIVYITFDVTNK